MTHESHAAARSNSSFTVRPATAADMAHMIALVNAAFAVETFIDGTRTDEERLAEMMRSGHLLVADDGSGHIAVAVYIELRGARGYFGMLAVDPARQGGGYGRKMVDAAEDFCRSRGCEAMDITVLSLRPELPPFYRKLGYTETGTEAFHGSIRSGQECHAIIMSKPLV
jgi:ribosomal protein S18 acetylase RimI-like enzyme